MKQKDIALIAVIVFISAIISFVVSNTFFGSPAKRQTQVEIVQPITASFPQPDNHYFNNNSIDPTKLIQIGQSQSTDPFNGASNQ